jgi:hypothetical protein
MDEEDVERALLNPRALENTLATLSPFLRHRQPLNIRYFRYDTSAEKHVDHGAAGQHVQEPMVAGSLSVESEADERDHAARPLR